MPESLLLCAARSSTTTTIGGPSQVSLEAGPSQDRVTIYTLPDDVLLQIFHFYRNHLKNGWHALVHVCQRWRSIVFASPRHLNLRLEYTGKRPMSEMLDVWPVLPVVIEYSKDRSSSYWGNVTGALESEHHHRICHIDLRYIPSSRWERLAAAMQKPFPELTSLWFWADGNTVTSLPDSFLGGSAPLLRLLWLENCPVQGLPKLLLSANQLDSLNLWNIPHSGYISPQDLVTALSVMCRLEDLFLGFQSPLYPASRPPPVTRSVLPALRELVFRGVHEYLEDLLAQVEVPFLNTLEITFFMDPDVVLPQLHRLISHTKSFKTCDRATLRTVRFGNGIQFSIFGRKDGFLSLVIWSIEFLDWHSEVCGSTLPLLSNLVQLKIVDDALRWTDDMDTTRWLELLDPFIAVKDLWLSHQVGRHVCQALEELAEERVTEVSPALQNIFLKRLKPFKSVPKYIERFVAARKLSGHPVAVHRWG
ncbi:hypothetical protein F5148DRAFT_743797 [Russula earlei]|uniref:Uncharacterized protein n=1 Tax=Russula earlei TaxID=71964 RepID=A0ACC0TT40_9AGAM|nr:hypothetical protein F5148DRAFT_743797 [Russula earlei]